MGSFVLEGRYALRERSVVLSLALTLLVACWAVIAGALETHKQHAEISWILEATQADKATVLAGQSDAGGAAYGMHHVTYEPPTPLAFAAIGTREDLPWQHWLTMLALEGQIYEADIGNPELSRVGRLDYAFLVSVLLPLVLILLLYDLDSRERRDGRYELLAATNASPRNPLLAKAGARTGLLFLSTSIPFAIVAVIENVAVLLWASVIVISALHLLFWLLVCRFVTHRTAEAPTAATALLACWLLFTIALPATARMLAEATVAIPAGGEILLEQREKVNDAWDLPKPVTMTSFIASHPEWEAQARVTQPFDWKWYFAFQQVGDEFIAPQSNALQAGIARRDRLMGWASLLSPPLATERWLTHLAGTNRSHHQRYMACVRKFHASLRHFHYPMLFGQQAFSPAVMAGLPSYKPCSDRLSGS